MSQALFGPYGGYPKAIPKSECRLRGLRIGGPVAYLNGRHEAWDMIPQVVASEPMACYGPPASRHQLISNIVNHAQEKLDGSKGITEVLRMISSLNAEEW